MAYCRTYVYSANKYVNYNRDDVNRMQLLVAVS